MSPMPNWAPPSELRLVVFDWDGTLIDSIGAILACTYAMLDELGLPHIDRDRMLALIGASLGSSVDALAPGASDEVRARVVETYRRLWFDEYHRRPTLIEGAKGALDELAESGALLGVATAKSRRGLATDLERVGLAKSFHASRTADETLPKPSPNMLLEILDELGVRSRHALMVGDSIHDIEMAHNAGVPVVAVSSGSQPEETLRAADPLDCLTSVAELSTWLGSRAPAMVGPGSGLGPGN